jgi:hypothetical protein
MAAQRGRPLGQKHIPDSRSLRFMLSTADYQRLQSSARTSNASMGQVLRGLIAELRPAEQTAA